MLVPGYLSPSSHYVGIDTSGGGLLVPGDIFRLVVSASALIPQVEDY
jgi:hypothetical protein